MRILNLIHSLDPAGGGAAEGLRQSVLATARLGHAEEVVTLDAPDAPWLAAYPVPVHAFGPVRGHYGYCPALVPWLKAHAANYDAVVVHGLWQYHGLAAWRALHRGPVPYFVYFHGMLDPWFKRAYPLKHLKKWLYWPWADYRLARDARAVLFTAALEAELAPQSFRLYRVKPAVVGYGLALDDTALAARADAFTRAYPQTAGKRLILFLARLHPKKGCDLLIDAYADAVARHPDLHLVLAGPDANGLRAELERQALKRGVADRITWTGMLQGELKWAALRAAEVFALPSHQENFGVAVAEALAVGLPVLISQRVNIWREIVDDGAGYAAADDRAGTSTMLGRWLELAPPQRAAMRAAAQACFRTRFHVDAAAARLVATIEPHLIHGPAT